MEGLYPLPHQAPETTGAQFSDTIEAVNPDEKCGFKAQDEVFCLAYGGS